MLPADSCADVLPHAKQLHPRWSESVAAESCADLQHPESACVVSDAADAVGVESLPAVYLPKPELK